MKRYFIWIALLACLPTSFSQVKTSENAFVSFYSELEDVTAENYSGVSELDPLTGRILFSFAVQSFYFDNATMQKHFNEADVMNSREFPRAKFVGSITNNTAVKYDQDGTYKLNVSGNLTMKGVTKAFDTKATLSVKGSKLTAEASFQLDRYAFGITGKEGSISQFLDLKVKVVYE